MTLESQGVKLNWITGMLPVNKTNLLRHVNLPGWQCCILWIGERCPSSIRSLWGMKPLLHRDTTRFQIPSEPSLFWIIWSLNQCSPGGGSQDGRQKPHGKGKAQYPNTQSGTKNGGLHREGVTFFSIRCTLHRVSCRPVYARLNCGKRGLELIDFGKTKENSP